MQIISNKNYSESVYLLKYIQKTGNPLQETFRTFLIKIKFTRDSQEALLIQIGVPIDKLNRNFLGSHK